MSKVHNCILLSNPLSQVIGCTSIAIKRRISKLRDLVGKGASADSSPSPRKRSKATAKDEQDSDHESVDEGSPKKKLKAKRKANIKSEYPLKCEQDPDRYIWACSLCTPVGFVQPDLVFTSAIKIFSWHVFFYFEHVWLFLSQYAILFSLDRFVEFGKNKLFILDSANVFVCLSLDMANMQECYYNITKSITN